MMIVVGWKGGGAGGNCVQAKDPPENIHDGTQHIKMSREILQTIFIIGMYYGEWVCLRVCVCIYICSGLWSASLCAV